MKILHYVHDEHRVTYYLLMYLIFTTEKIRFYQVLYFISS